MLSDSDSNGHIANSAAEANGSELFAKVLIVGGGPVGCLTALKLGKAGIKVDIIERLPSTSNAQRAVGYFGAVHFVFEELGLYSKIRKAGFVTPGLCWFKKPRDNGQGGKAFGEMLAAQPLAEPGDVEFKVGAGLLNLTQARLNALLLDEALATGHVKIYFNTEFESILANSRNGVVARARNLETGEETVLRSQYLVGTDGARSGTRKALQLPFAGHTWPERLIATDVVMMNEELLSYPTYFVLDRVHYSVSTPLEKPIKGEKSLWRFTFGSDPNDTRPDEELMSDDNIMSLYERNMAGQRPLDVKITNRAVYKIHQRLAPTLRKGNCILAGDAAHANNVSILDARHRMLRLICSRTAVWRAGSQHGHP